MAMMLKSSVKAGVARPMGRRATVRVQAAQKLNLWLPGSDRPAHLEAATDLAGNYGFDPLNLGADKDSLARFRESEVIHGRWAMLGVAGALAVELLGYGNWYDAPLSALNGGKSTYFGAEIPFDLNTLVAIEFVAFAAAEGSRNNEPEAIKRVYPGGAFDPLGFSKDAAKLDELKLKEVKNGRLAMTAFLGFVAQHAATGKGPVAALGEHLANPWGANFGTNGVSLPF